MPKELTQGVVDAWVESAVGRFTTKNIWDELDIQSTQGKSKLRVYLHRLVKEGKIIALAHDGTYRKVDDKLNEINWQTANPERFVPLKLPFGMEKFVKIYPKSILIFTGTKSAGKTALIYNFVKDNMNAMNVDLYNSETGPEQMKERFDALGDIPNPAPFKVFERYDNFADVIDPDNISVIDYLDFNSELYLVGTEIDNIFRKLKDGVAVIALQKPPAQTIMTKSGEKKTIERDLAYGGAFSAKRSQLYLSLSNNEDKQLRTCKIVYAKARMNGNINPVNMQWAYKLDERYGVKITEFKRHIEVDSK